MLDLPPDAEPPADEQVWTLTHGGRTAVLWQSLHPLGLELRLEVNGDVGWTTVARTVDQARAERARLRDGMVTKGWATGQPDA